MKGFVVRHKGKEWKAGVSVEGSLGNEFILQEYESHWNTAGYVALPEAKSVVWNSDVLNVGDDVEIEFAEFNEASKTLNDLYSTDEEIRQHVAPTNHGDYLLMVLNEFRSLERLLGKEPMPEVQKG